MCSTFLSSKRGRSTVSLSRPYQCPSPRDTRGVILSKFLVKLKMRPGSNGIKQHYSRVKFDSHVSELKCSLDLRTGNTGTMKVRKCSSLFQVVNNTVLLLESIDAHVSGSTALALRAAKGGPFKPVYYDHLPNNTNRESITQELLTKKK